MQAYMKSAMQYHGVPAPMLRASSKKIFSQVELSSREDWRAKVLELWRGAKYREERYLAILLTGDARAAAFQTPRAMALYEEIIVTGAWWDYVDDVATHRVGPILGEYLMPMKKKMVAWSASQNLWKRRTPIICQLGFNEHTDLDLCGGRAGHRRQQRDEHRQIFSAHCILLPTLLRSASGMIGSAVSDWRRVRTACFDPGGAPIGSLSHSIPSWGGPARTTARQSLVRRRPFSRE